MKIFQDKNLFINKIDQNTSFKYMARRSNSGVRDIRVNALDKASESVKMSKVYSTAKINQILDDIKRGKKPDLDPFFHGKKEYRDCGITFERTEEEDEEYRKCALDCLYFVENYVKFKNDKGFTLVTLRDYQKEVLHLMSDEKWDEELQDVTFCNRRVCLLQSRQTSKCFSPSQFINIMQTPHFYSSLNNKKYNLCNIICAEIKKYVKTVVKNIQQKVVNLYIKHAVKSIQYK